MISGILLSKGLVSLLFSILVLHNICVMYIVYHFFVIKVKLPGKHILAQNPNIFLGIRSVLTAKTCNENLFPGNVIKY